MHYEDQEHHGYRRIFQGNRLLQGKVELITGEGDRLNLKSKLCQYVSLTSILKTDVEIPELELVAYEPEDTEKIIKFLMKG